MNPFYPEKTDGMPIQLNDRIRLEDGTSVTIREFLQMPGLGGGLTFGRISLGNLEQVEDFTLTNDTILNTGRLSGNPKGEVFGTVPDQGEPLYHICAYTTFSNSANIYIDIPSSGYVIFSVFEEGTDPNAVLLDQNNIGAAAVGFAAFGGQTQVIYATNVDGEYVEGTLPSGAISNSVRLIIEDGLISIEGIPQSTFAMPYLTSPTKGIGVTSVGIFEPVPTPFFFSLLVGSGEPFVNPPDWAPGNIYEITSPGQLYGLSFTTGDFAIVVSNTQVIPIRVGEFLSRLEVVGIISETVDGYIVSAPVQELIRIMVQTIIDSQYTAESPLRDYILNNSRSDLFQTLTPQNFGTDYFLFYFGPSKVFIPNRQDNINIFIDIPLWSTDTQRSFRLLVARSNPGVNRELTFTVRDFGGNARPVEFSGDLTVIGNSQHYVGFSLPSEKAAMVEIVVWTDQATAFIVATQMGNSALDLGPVDVGPL